MREQKVLNEFKEFAMRGRVLDMAVGVIIGVAFGKIVSSLVDDILMPPKNLNTLRHVAQAGRECPPCLKTSLKSVKLTLQHRIGYSLSLIGHPGQLTLCGGHFRPSMASREGSRLGNFGVLSDRA